jgi:hypothetical protein
MVPPRRAVRLWYDAEKRGKGMSEDDFENMMIVMWVFFGWALGLLTAAGLHILTK